MNPSTWTLLGHILVTVSAIGAVTAMALLHVIDGTTAVVVILGATGISGPSLGRPTPTPSPPNGNARP